MAHVVREDVDSLNAKISIQLKVEEYKPEFEEELKKHRGKSHLKGFRKGKTPMGMIRKMYGLSIMGELIDNKVNRALTDFLIENKISFLGNPIPSEKQAEQDFDPNMPKDLEFIFDLGLVPAFEPKGLDDKKKFNNHKVKVDPKNLDTELTKLLKRLGTQKPTEEKIAEDDILRFSASELEGKTHKIGGYHVHFDVAAQDLTEAAAKKVMGKKTGLKFKFNVYELEKDRDEEFVRKQILKLDPEDPIEVGTDFELTIDEVIRLKPAEPTKENLEQLFGPGSVSTEEEAKEFIKTDLEKFYGNQADGVLFKQVQEHLIKENEGQMPLPEDFLKRWLRTRNKEEELSEEQLEADFPLFAEDLRWRLIKDKLLEQFEVSVTEEDIKEGFRARFVSYLGGMAALGGNEELLDQTISRAMENQEQVESVRNEISTEHLFRKLKESIKTADKSITEAKFKELQEEYLKKP